MPATNRSLPTSYWGIVLFFLVASGSFVYYRKKQTGTMPGADTF
ncbi:unnamed protein product [Linum tenue]|uniref:LPXTG cell wall anchor domain-containing protein n=1 Tax=Linum tenue TaxID=586396 RepID=A0AAV0KRL0_9ROSI|nr:unnamed protein product [Linum tenue]